MLLFHVFHAASSLTDSAVLAGALVVALTNALALVYAVIETVPLEAHRRPLARRPFVRHLAFVVRRSSTVSAALAGMRCVVLSASNFFAFAHTPRDSSVTERRVTLAVRC